MPLTSPSPSPRLLPPLPGRGHLPWWRLGLSSARQAFDGIARHRLRSALAMVALVVGVAAVLLVLAVGQFALRATAGGFDGVGANTITVDGFVLAAAPDGQGGSKMAVRVGAGESPSLTLQDVQTLRQLPHVIATSPDEPEVVQAVAGDHSLRTAAFGAYPDVQTIRGYTLHAGSFFSQSDAGKSATVAVLGSDAAAKLFPGASAVGQQVRLNAVDFTVVGVLQALGTPPGVHEEINNVPITQDGSIIVPATTWLQRLQGQQPGGKGGSPAARRSATFPMVQVEADATGNIPAVQDEIRRALEQSHHIAPGGKDDFQVSNFLAAAAAERQSLTTVELAMGIVAAIALLLGGFGVASVLLAAVSERTKEIGLRLAVGAEPSDIHRQFLIEAVTLSLLGGLAGSAFGLALAPNLGRLLGGHGGVPPTPLATGAALGAALLLGLLFGFYPARRASRLDPVEALRRM